MSWIEIQKTKENRKIKIGIFYFRLAKDIKKILQKAKKQKKLTEHTKEKLFFLDGVYSSRFLGICRYRKLPGLFIKKNELKTLKLNDLDV